MGLSSVFALKMAAMDCYNRGDFKKGDRLMKQYHNALALAEKEKAERIKKKLKAAELKKRVK